MRDSRFVICWLDIYFIQGKERWILDTYYILLFSFFFNSMFGESEIETGYLPLKARVWAINA